MKKSLFTTYLFFQLSILSFGQNCANSVVPPTTINGVSVTSTSTGSASTYANSFTSCTYTTPTNSIHLGATGSFSYTFNFSTPINNLVILLNATGSGANEVFTFTTDVGTPIIIDNSSCFSSVTGNTISSGMGSASDGGGGEFTISGPCFSTLTITGPGGTAGSLFALCSSSVGTCTPTCSVEATILPSGSICSNDLQLQAQSDSAGGTWQWYINNSPVATETNSSIDISANNYGTGTYSVIYTYQPNCTDTALFTVTSGCIEICNNGIDDDGNGMIDLNDTACSCSGFGSTQVIGSLIPNSSFEDYSSCPTSFSQLSRANTWTQASAATSDYYNCSFTNFSGNGAPPTPTPDGSGYVGFYDGAASRTPQYKEYVGACLLSPMLANVPYTLNFYIADNGTSSAIDITLFGTSNCSNLPFGGTNDLFGCPTNGPGFVQLATTNINPGASGTWELVSLSFTPTQDILAVVIGGGCVGSNGTNYYYVDDLKLVETSGLASVQITPNGGYCSNDLQLVSHTDTTGGAWQWYHEGVALVGQTDSVLNLSGSNFQTGTYQVVYQVGTKCEQSQYIVDIPSLPTASFSADSICQGASTQFFDQSNDSSGVIIGWQWDFNNDGIIDDTNQTPSYTYDTPGSYSATLIVTSSNGCKDSVSSDPNYTANDYTSAPYITVYPSPTANFTFDTVCFENSTSFTDSSYGGVITQWEWIIEGNTYTIQNPSHTFSNLGPFNTFLKVTSNNGCVDSLFKQTVLKSPPIASFTYTGKCLNEKYIFTNQTTEGEIQNPPNYNYTWDFGDGNLASIENPTPFFNFSGSFTVTLTATSPEGCVDDTSMSIYVNPPPIADFSYTSVCLGEEMDITNQSIISSGTILSNTWNIEQSTYNSTNVSYTFSKSGFNDVELVEVSDSGCRDSIIKPVEVYELPIAQFDYSPKEVDFIDSRVCFLNESKSSDSYVWDFGFNGLQSASDNPCIDFPVFQEGEYTVTLITTTINGCQDSTKQTIQVKEAFTLFVPNAFTPESDGVNDIFLPKYSGVTEAELFIFDRWGELLFQTNQINNGWDGTHKGEPVKADVYIYRVIVRDNFNKKHEVKGHVNLIR